MATKRMLDNQTGKVIEVSLNDYLRGGGNKRFTEAPLGPTAEDLLLQTSTNLVNQTQPLRDQLFQRSNDFLSGGFDITSTPEYMAGKMLAGQNAKLAKKNILETMPAGGTLLDKLADVDIGTAHTMTGLGADMYGRELDRGISLATGTPLAAGMGGFNSILNLMAAREGAAAQEDAAKSQMWGYGLGGLLGGLF